MQGHWTDENIWVGSDGIDRSDLLLYTKRQIKFGGEKFFMQRNLKAAKEAWGSARGFQEASYMTEAFTESGGKIWETPKLAEFVKEVDMYRKVGITNHPLYPEYKKKSEAPQ